MTDTTITALRLMPSAEGDIAQGLRAEVADPVWFLARQWQLGEHRGEDSASPVTVSYETLTLPIRDAAMSRSLRGIPAEAILEGQPDDWWTVGRRIDYGIRFLELLDTHISHLLDRHHPLRELGGRTRRLTGLPAPYTPFEGSLDGRAVHALLADLLHQPKRTVTLRDSLRRSLDDLVASVPSDPMAPVDHWVPGSLWYDSDSFAAVTDAGHVELKISRHAGGRVDWYTADVRDGLETAITAANSADGMALPAPLRFPGAPDPRWWAMEDHTTDLGSYSPDRTQAGAMLIVDLVSSHGDGWFTFPVGARGVPVGTVGLPVGSLVVLRRVVVTDAFDDTHDLTADPTNGETFRLTGDEPRPDLRCCVLSLWPTVTLPLRADTPLDEVLLVVDQDANAVWAQERRVGGQPQTNLTRDDDSTDTPPGLTLDTSAPAEFTYHPMLRRGDRWYRYVPQVDQDGSPTALLGRQAVRNPEVAGDPPVPKTGLLPRHLDPASIPWTGIVVERRYVLAREAGAGTPVLWTTRATRPLVDQPAVLLRFDTASSP